MSYADITFCDKNPIKRLLQQRRLTDALQLATHFQNINVALDFGAGNGELSKQLVITFPQAQIICYEPHLDLMAEAQKNAEGLKRIGFVTDIGVISPESVDLLYCLEVFEHLPEKEAEAALSAIYSVLRNSGIAIIGVPVEVHLPALYKGIFRMTRRFGDFDATPGNILKATFGYPIKHRPVSEITTGWPYHFHHLGFDYRCFRELLGSKKMHVLKQSASPIPALGVWINPEVYFVVQKINNSLSPFQPSTESPITYV
jgi:SAM-dependent methyltransferase